MFLWEQTLREREPQCGRTLAEGHARPVESEREKSPRTGRELGQQDLPVTSWAPGDAFPWHMKEHQTGLVRQEEGNLKSSFEGENTSNLYGI